MLNLKPSHQCSSLIQRFERCRLVGYLPTPHDIPTIGWGSTGRGIFVGLHWTQAQADARFDSDLAVFGTAVDHLLGGAATTQDQFDALVSFAYNVGAKALASSTLLRKHTTGDYAGAAEEFARWNKQAGVVLAGLTKRRAAEAALYRGQCDL